MHLRSPSFESLKLVVLNEKGVPSTINIDTPQPLRRFGRCYSIKMVEIIKEDDPTWAHKCFWTNVVQDQHGKPIHERRHSTL
jgi:hypothetical protein